MSLVEPTLISLGRSFGIAFGTLMAVVLLGPAVGTNRRVLKMFFWASMLALMAPALPGETLLMRHVSGKAAPTDFFPYSALIWIRYAPLALLALWLIPPPASAAALHCFRAGTASSWWPRMLWRVRAMGAGLWVGFALVFLFAFQEFELATTWNIRSWTVALFDAQVGGLALRESLRLAILPLVIQVLVLGCLGCMLRPVPRREVAHDPSGGLEIVLAFAGVLFTCLPWALLIPVGIVCVCYPHGAEAISLVAPWREIGNSAGLALAAAVFTWPVAGWMERQRGGRLLLLVPGLLGPLMCGLLVLAITQIPGCDGMRDSIFTPVLGLGLALLPYAVLLRLGLRGTSDHASLHIARSVRARWPLWKLVGWPRLAGFLLLFYFAYTDFTINSLLAPPQFVSAGVRLLNLLHYGYSPALLGMYLVATLVPLLAVGLTILTAHLYARCRVR